MMMRKGERVRCQNPECAAELEVIKDSIEGESSITCCCGAVMKKPYNKPALAIGQTDDPIPGRSFGQGA
jgi:hypothetical protein